MNIIKRWKEHRRKKAELEIVAGLMEKIRNDEIISIDCKRSVDPVFEDGGSMLGDYIGSYVFFHFELVLTGGVVIQYRLNEQGNLSHHRIVRKLTTRSDAPRDFYTVNNDQARLIKEISDETYVFHKMG